MVILVFTFLLRIYIYIYGDEQKWWQWFSVHAVIKRSKMFLAENIFMENNFPKNIFRLKSFYVEVNGV
jgi:uncharacterized protein YozE (UPF0346 family)